MIEQLESRRLCAKPVEVAFDAEGYVYGVGTGTFYVAVNGGEPVAVFSVTSTGDQVDFDIHKVVKIKQPGKPSDEPVEPTLTFQWDGGSVDAPFSAGVTLIG